MIETKRSINTQTLEGKMPELRPGTPPGMRLHFPVIILAASAKSLKVQLEGGAKVAFLPKSLVNVDYCRFSRGPQTVTLPVWLYTQVRKELI